MLAPLAVLAVSWVVLAQGTEGVPSFIIPTVITSAFGLLFIAVGLFGRVVVNTRKAYRQDVADLEGRDVARQHDVGVLQTANDNYRRREMMLLQLVSQIAREANVTIPDDFWERYWR